MFHVKRGLTMSYTFRIYWSYDWRDIMERNWRNGVEFFERYAFHFDIVTYPHRISVLASNLWGWEFDKHEMTDAIHAALNGDLGICDLANKKYRIAIRIVK